MTPEEIGAARAAWKEAVAKDGPFAYGTVVDGQPVDGVRCPRCAGVVTWPDPGRWQCPECGALPAPDEQPGGAHA